MSRVGNNTEFSQVRQGRKICIELSSIVRLMFNIFLGAKMYKSGLLIMVVIFNVNSLQSTFNTLKDCKNECSVINQMLKRIENAFLEKKINKVAALAELNAGINKMQEMRASSCAQMNPKLIILARVRQSAVQNLINEISYRLS